MPTIYEILKAGDTSWTPPSGVTSVNVHCFGAAGDSSTGSGGKGGGGGAYSFKGSLAVSGSTSCQIGAGGSASDTWFKSSGDVLAKAGQNASSSGDGGLASSGVGDTKYSGGNGNSGGAYCSGGGGSAGPSGDGKNGGQGAAIRGGGGGGGSNGGSSTAGSNSTVSNIGGDGGAGNGGTGGGTGGNGSAGGAGSNGGGGGGGGGTVSQAGGAGGMQALWTDNSGGAYDSESIGPGGGGGGSSSAGGAGGSGGPAGGGGGGATTAGQGGDGFIVLEYESPVPAAEASDALHGHTADAVTLTPSAAISINGATSAHTADSVPIAPAAVCAPSDATSGHSADPVTVLADASVVPADAGNAHSADNVAMTASAPIAIDSALHRFRFRPDELFDHELLLDYRNSEYTSGLTITGSLDDLSATHTQSGSCFEINAAGDGLVSFGPNDPRIVPGLGLWCRSGFTNKCTNYNANPTDLTNIAKIGDAAATLTVVDDSAELAAAGLDGICTSGKVYKLDNSAGTGDAFATPQGATGNTNAHTVSCYLRCSGTVDLYVSGAFSTAARKTNQTTYVRAVNPGQMPSNSSNTMTIRALPGATVYFILNQLVEGVQPGPIIPTTATTASTGASVHTIPFEQADEDFVLLVAVNMAEGSTGATRNIARLKGATISDLITLALSSTDQLIAAVAAGGVSQSVGSIGLQKLTSGRGVFAIRRLDGKFKQGCKTGASATVIGSEGTASTFPTGLASLHVGHLDGVQQLSGIVERVGVIRAALSDEELTREIEWLYADNATVTADAVCQPASCTHANTADAVSPIAHVPAVIASADHAHTAESPVVTAIAAVTTADATHALASDAATLIPWTACEPADAAHAHAAENVDIPPSAPVVAANASHAHTADSAILTARAVAAIAEATHAHIADSVTLTAHVGIATNDATHAHTADQATQIAHAQAEPENCTHAHAAESPAQAPHIATALADCTHTHSADNVIPIGRAIAAPADAFHAHTADSATLDEWTPSFQRMSYGDRPSRNYVSPSRSRNYVTAVTGCRR